MERDGGHLEEEAHQQQRDAGQEEAVLSRRGERRRQLGELHRARRAVHQREAVEEEAGREGAEQEVLQRALVGRALLAHQPGEHVETDRHRLEPDEERDEAAR